MSDHIVIAGAGPAGLMLACELGLAGVPATVLEPLAERSHSAPGMAINSGCVETLDQRGLMEPIREETFVLPGAHFSLIWLDLARHAEPHADAYMVPQALLEELLEERATALGAEIRRGHRVTGFEQDDDGVRVRVRSATGEYSLRSGYLAGCDGRDSTVRSLAGIEFTGTEDPECSGIIGDVEVNFPDLAPEHFGAHISPSGAIYTGGPVGPGLLRVITIQVGVPAPPRTAAVSAEEFFGAVREITGADLVSGPPRWLSRFRDTTKNARRYRSGRVFLAGDAAHVSYPVNGLGLSTAVQDSVNLGWKLAAQILGWAPDGLLGTYHDERHPVGARVCRDARAQANLVHPPERVNDLRQIITDLLAFDGVQEYLLGMVTGVDARYPMPAVPSGSKPHPLLGRRLPYVPIRTAAGESMVVSVLRPGRGVLLDLSGGAGAPASVSGWKDRVDVVSAEPTDAIPASAVLLRPDGHVAWVAEESPAGTTLDDTGLADALAAWFGQTAE